MVSQLILLCHYPGDFLEKHLKSCKIYVDKSEIEILAIGVDYDVSRYCNKQLKLLMQMNWEMWTIFQLSTLFDKNKYH